MVKISALAKNSGALALAALSEAVPASELGKSLDVSLQDTGEQDFAVAIHTFECLAPGYPGWYWAVSVIAISDQDYGTVSEINLLPGPDALVPPAWHPWAERVQAGDLGVGDLLPAPANDPRLTAGFTGLAELESELAELHPMQWELGLGREKILSELGLEQAVNRWMSGQTGPRSLMAKSAPADCSTCGFLIPVGGSLGQAFGMCGNEYGAADGRVVAMNFGCGAHSAVEVTQNSPVPVVDLAVDDFADEIEPVDPSPGVDLSEQTEDDAS
ncbi:MAG: DUF3027 domain-containing protein [Actinobacteria bacterium]|nr:DUF3027 domain-containing protein [Actinomycetota bacterium]